MLEQNNPDSQQAGSGPVELGGISMRDVDRAVLGGLAWLLDRWRDNTPPDSACRLLATLRATNPGIDIDLVWEKEDYSGTVHYDLLIQVGDSGSISLSFCPDRAVPWALRNAVRSPDDWVVKVNGRAINAPTAMTTMDVIWDRTDLVQGLVNIGLMDEAVTSRGLTAGEAELQQAMDAFRRKHRLLTKAETLRYLEEHALTQRDLERLLEGQVLNDKLRDEVTQGNIESYFEAHRADFETARVARFRVADQAEAGRIATRLRSEPDGFFQEAQDRFLGGTQSGPVFAVLRRGALTAEQAEAVFRAAPGEIVVAPSGEGFDVVRVLRIDPARLDESTRGQVRQAAFDAWLAEGRRNAQIIWFWGDPERLVNQNTGWAG